MDNDDDYIRITERNDDDFRKSVLAGEVRPHDVTIIITDRNGQRYDATIKWDTIYDLYKWHDIRVIQEHYELMAEQYL